MLSLPRRLGVNTATSIARWLTDCGVLTRCDCLFGAPRLHLVSDLVSLQDVEPTSCITI
jgi:hypothetical protein